jgi:hypothetical protein
MCCVYRIGYYSAIKNEIKFFACKWIQLNNIMLSQASSQFPMIEVAYFPSSVEICLLLYVKRDRDRERERERERKREHDCISASI